jgi:hypothetical protein
MFGKIEYNEDGNPKCEICGKHFARVMTHVRQKHEMSERDYKLQFGLDLGKGICSQESAESTRVKTLSNYDKCISKNLINNGSGTRFVVGSKGRTKDKVSEETRNRLINHIKTIKCTQTH